MQRKIKTSGGRAKKRVPKWSGHHIFDNDLILSSEKNGLKKGTSQGPAFFMKGPRRDRYFLKKDLRGTVKYGRRKTG